MGKTSEVVRPIVYIIGGIFVLQVPLFIVLLKLAELKGLDNSDVISLATAGQALLLGSWNITSPSVMVDIASPHSSNCSEPGEISSSAAFKPLSFAHYPFVLFSVYRLTLSTFYVHGITSVIVRRHENDQPVYRCEWVPAAGNSSSGSTSGGVAEAIVTEAQMLYVWFDENGMAYVPAVVSCTFNQSVGADGDGGLLRLHLSRGPSFWDPHYAVENVFRESPGDVNEKPRAWLMSGVMQAAVGNESPSSTLATAEEELRYKYAFCGPPLYGRTLNKDWIPKWLAYHHFLWEGKAHFFFYVAEDLDEEARNLLEPWIGAGLLTIIDALGGEAYPSWYRNQLLFINDCLSRTRFMARWTFFHDLDELLYVPAPNTLPGLLEEHRDKPWMTFGNLPFSTDHCRQTQQALHLSAQPPHQSSGEGEGEGDWQLERFLWRNKQPECMHEWEDPWTCVAAPGRRKLVVNPRKVFLSGVHRVALPEGGGVNFNASVARIHHFHGITNPSKPICDRLVNMSDDSNPLSYELDEAMASIMLQVRTFAGPLLLPPLRQ